MQYTLYFVPLTELRVHEFKKKFCGWLHWRVSALEMLVLAIQDDLASFEPEALNTANGRDELSDRLRDISNRRKDILDDKDIGLVRETPFLSLLALDLVSLNFYRPLFFSCLPC